MEWHSPEVEQFYTILNNVYTTLLINKHPYVKKMYIDPESFNKIFLDETSLFNSSVKVIMCADFNSVEFRNKKEETSLGTDTSQMLYEIPKMIPNSEVLKGKKIYADLELNVTKHCKDVVTHHRDL